MCAAGRVGTAVAAGNKESIRVTILRAASRAGKVTGASATGTRIAGTASSASTGDTGTGTGIARSAGTRDVNCTAGATAADIGIEG